MSEIRKDNEIEEILEKLAREKGAVEDSPPGDDVIVGEKIRKVREERGLTIQDLAEKTGFSAALLTQIENRMISPPLGVLVEVANALGESISDFLFEGEGKDFSIVRKKERKIVSRVASKDGASEDYTYESLGAGKRGRKMEPFVVRLKPLKTSTPRLSVHQGEEFIYVLEGKVEVILDKYKDTLESGDSIYYNSTIPHHVHSATEEPALILAVIYQGTSSGDK
ncbi:MAG: XRE family transcriptional regulator [Deltaproteobacteria bacterium]|nr:MAG: XRE family transcriptional regulator [Deltaproteobacteria bacterium]